MNKVVAIVGMCGTGKSSVSEIFVRNGWKKVAFGDAIIEIVKEKGMEITPENEKTVREELSGREGGDALAKKTLPTIQEILLTNNVIIDSLYSWAEYKLLKKHFGNTINILCIISDKKVRYRRLANRRYRPLTEEEAVNRDISEIEMQQKGGPIAIADRYIFNNGSLEHLQLEVTKYLRAWED